MKRGLMALAALVILGGCSKSIAQLDQDDDTYCRATVAQRNDRDPNAYALCRQNVQGYRTQQAIRQSGN